MLFVYSFELLHSSRASDWRYWGQEFSLSLFFILKGFFFLSIYLTNPSTVSRMWHYVNLKLSIAGLNFEFFFWTVGLNKSKEPSLPPLFSSCWGGRWVHTFPKRNSMKSPRIFSKSKNQSKSGASKEISITDINIYSPNSSTINRMGYKVNFLVFQTGCLTKAKRTQFAALFIYSYRENMDSCFS